ncbi:hypothetical protein PAAL109150_07995 [Paenibacillus alkaliterrae]
MSDSTAFFCFCLFFETNIRFCLKCIYSKINKYDMINSNKYKHHSEVYPWYKVYGTTQKHLSLKAD